MGDRLDQLGLGEAVLVGEREVERELFGVSTGHAEPSGEPGTNRMPSRFLRRSTCYSNRLGCSAGWSGSGEPPVGDMSSATVGLRGIRTTRALRTRAAAYVSQNARCG